MELDEMKILWEEMNQKIENQKTLTDNIIMEMTRERFKNRFAKITAFETAGTVVCFAMVLVVLFNFNKLDTWYLAGSGIFAIVFLIALPIAVLRGLYEIRNLNIGMGNFKEVLNQYAKQQSNLLRIQRFGIYFNVIFLFVSLLLAGKIMNNKDLLREGPPWFWMIPAGLFLYFISRWSYGHYVRITKSAEDILKELEN